ncbi:MAG: MoxR family ATPase [Erysipelotrichaceae bacterium]|nr:MoxR family ATPase [Erysipelotrichaceae bacterium]
MEMKKVLQEMRKAVYGKDEILREIMMAICADGHVVMEDKPGVGKTTIAKTIAKVTGLSSKRIQFTSDVMPSDVTGYMTYNKTRNTEEFVPGPIFDTNILLVDEINRASAKCQAALLEVMQEKQATINAVTRRVEDPFIVLATMNPYISPIYGVNVLPQSELDRFMLAISIGYPKESDEIALLRSRDRKDPLEELQQVTNKEEILQARKEINEVYVDYTIYGYVLSLAKQTRNHPDIEIGISPRGELVLLRMAKANAYFMGRSYVIPEDIAEIFIDCTIHRISMVSQELTIISEARKRILKEILKKVPQPSILRKAGK